MKNIDKIIQEEVRAIINEQTVEKIPFNGKMMTRGQIAVSGTDTYINTPSPKISQIGVPWPSNVPRKKATPQIESFFKKIGAVPYSFTSMPAKEANLYPVWHLNIGNEHYTFQYDPKFKYNMAFDNTNHKLYWRYVNDTEVFAKHYRDEKTYNDNNALLPGGYDVKAWNKKNRADWTKMTMGSAAQFYTGSEKGVEMIQVFTDEAGTKGFFYIFLYNGKPIFQYFKNTKERTDAEYARIQKEKDHAVLDILGFIPIIGDLGDLYNACWYFADWANEGHKWQDMLSGFLSLVAVFGPIGSAYAAMIKPVFKRLGKIIKSSADLNSPKTLIQVVRAINNNTGIGTISREQAKQLAAVIETISKAMVKYKLQMKEALTKLGVEDPDALLIEINQLLVKLEKAAEDVAHYGSKAKKIATNLNDPVIQSLEKIGFWKEVARGWGSMAFKNSALEAAKISIPLIRKLGYGIKTANITRLNTEMLMAAVTNRQSKRLIKQIEKSFTAGVVADPTRALALFQTATNARTRSVIRAKIFNTVGENIQTMATNTTNVLKKGTILLPAQMAEYYRICPRLYKSGQIVETASMPIRTLKTLIKNGWLPNTKQTFAYMSEYAPKELDNLLAKYGSTDMWTGAAEYIARACIKNGHPVWNYVVSNPAQHLKTLMPESVGDFFKMIRNNMLDGKKWLDIYWGIIQNGAADIKAPDQENRQSIVYNALIESLLENTPEWSKENLLPLVKKYIEKTRSTTLPASERPANSTVDGIPSDSTTILPAATVRRPKKTPAGVTPQGKAVKSNPFLKTL